MTIQREALTASKAIESLKFEWAGRPDADLIVSLNIDSDKFLILNLVKNKEIGVHVEENVIVSISLNPNISLVEIVERFAIESIRGWGGEYARFKS